VEQPSSQPIRVLIADDDPAMVEVLMACLGGEFEIVAAAKDAEEAIALAVAHTPDAAIVDVQMPLGGGLRAAHGIREGAPGTAIVALSADESRQGVLDMLDAGTITYIRKGVQNDEIALKVRQAVAAHQP